MEDHIRDLEVQGENWRKEEAEMLKSAMARQERDKLDECDQLKSEIFSLRSDLLSASEDVIKFQLLVEKFKNEKSELIDKIYSRDEEIEGLKNEIAKQRSVNQRIRSEERANIKLIEVLSQELEDLGRTQQASDDEKIRSSSNASESKDMRCLLEIKEELQKLREENKSLRETNEELEAQLLVNHLEEGRSLLREEEAASSLAEELNNLSVEPVS